MQIKLLRVICVQTPEQWQGSLIPNWRMGWEPKVVVELSKGKV